MGTCTPHTSVIWYNWRWTDGGAPSSDGRWKVHLISKYPRENAAQIPVGQIRGFMIVIAMVSSLLLLYWLTVGCRCAPDSCSGHKIPQDTFAHAQPKRCEIWCPRECNAIQCNVMWCDAVNVNINIYSCRQKQITSIWLVAMPPISRGGLIG